MLQGLIIGVVGTAVGAVAGVRAGDDRSTATSCFACRRTSTRCPTCRSRVLPLDLVMVVGAAMLICFVGDHLSVAPGGPPRSGAGA